MCFIRFLITFNLLLIIIIEDEEGFVNCVWENERLEST